MINGKRFIVSSLIWRQIIQVSSLVMILILPHQVYAADKSDVEKKPKSVRDVGSIVLSGSTADPFTNLIAFDYMKVQPEALISVRTIGAYNVWKGVVQQTAQLGIVAGNGPVAELKKILYKNKLNLIIKKIGTLGLAVVVNKTNPIQDISLADLKKIYTGEINNWSKISQSDHAIKLYAPSPEEFARTFVNEELVTDGKVITNAQISRPSASLNTILPNDADGIGIMSLNMVGPNVKMISVNNIPLDLETITNKNYPLLSELRVIYLDSSNHTTHDFAKFVLTRKLNKKWLDAMKIVGLEEVED